MTGFGATETAPFALTHRHAGAFAGMIGLPAPGHGAEARAGRVEDGSARAWSEHHARLSGAMRRLTAAAFDEEGFYRLGDAMELRRSGRSAQGPGVQRPPGRGLQALHRHLGQRRAAARADPGAGAPASHRTSSSRGHDRDVRRQRWSFRTCTLPRARRRRCPMRRAREVLAHPAVSARFQTIFDDLAATEHRQLHLRRARDRARRPPSIDAREITDKGSINQKAVLQHRAALVDELYSTSPVRARDRRRGPTT